MATPAPEELYYAVQRGDQVFQCLGSELNDKLEDGDVMAVHRPSEGVTYGWVLEEAAEPKPWDNHPGGVFHVKNVTAELDLSGGPFTAWNVDGTNERQISKIAAGEELVFVTGPNVDFLFENYYKVYVEWDFGEFTDTSKVTSMIGMFNFCFDFNSDISDWNVSNVTSMRSMFYDNYNFNSDISNWDVSNVERMGSMFNDARVFNQDISNWNVRNVTDMAYMFENARVFNQDLSEWCVTLITNGPPGFDLGADAWTEPRPVWGTCPRGEDQP